MKPLNLSIFLPTLLFFFAVLSGLVIYRSASFVQDKHFSLLANSFIHKDLFLNPYGLPNGDYVDFHGRQYLYFGPMPSIILIPFVLVSGKNFPQMTLSVTSLIFTFIGIFLLSRKFKFSKINSFWLANFFVFGTVLYFVGLVNISAYVAQAVAVPFVIFAFLEYFGKRRWFLVGILVAAAGATRITLFGSASFFILEIIRQKNLNWQKSIVYFLIPIIFCISVLGYYNLRRFHSVFDTGYTRNITTLNKEGDNHAIGFFSIRHLPANLYALLFMGPEPLKQPNLYFVLRFPYLKANGDGLAIWYTSPLFIYLLFAKRKQFTLTIAAAIIVLLLPSILYSGIGTSQYGYRYSLDFIPLIFVILIASFEGKLPKFAKVLIAYGIIFNCFYMLSIWNSYPLLSFWKYF